MFAMFQKKGIGFKQIQRKKRLDRAMQLVCIGTVLTGMGLATKALIGVVARATETSQTVISLSMLLVGVLAGAVKKMTGSAKATAAWNLSYASLERS